VTVVQNTFTYPDVSLHVKFEKMLFQSLEGEKEPHSGGYQQWKLKIAKQWMGRKGEGAVGGEGGEEEEEGKEQK